MNRRVRIKTRMALLGMTASDVAGKAAISVAQMSMIINSKRDPKPATAERIAKVLQSSVVDLGLGNDKGALDA
jgi:transcriptional regulator with XRE-family HTH domain